MCDGPIPPLRRPEGWESVPIQECGEPLVSLKDLAPAGILSQPEYFRQNLPGALGEIYLRTSVAKRLESAAKLLPKGLKLVIFDGWRPTELQTALFKRHLSDVESANPNADCKDIIEETRRYVSLPSTSPRRPAPHLTGGAVDLSICKENGELLEMGTAFDAFDEAAAATYYEEKLEPGSGSDLQEPLRNRRLLYWIMTGQGFTAYSEEWWHFDYGNQFWGCNSDQHAIYGPVTDLPASSTSQETITYQ